MTTRRIRVRFVLILIFLNCCILAHSQKTVIKYFTDSEEILDSNYFRKAKFIEVYAISSNDTLRLEKSEILRLLSLNDLYSISFYETIIGNTLNVLFRELKSNEINFNGCKFILSKINFNKDIQFLNFVNCDISQFNLKSLNYKNLKALSLTSCHVSEMPKWLYRHKGLKHLDLSGNKLKIDRINNCVTSLETLVLIDCSLYEFQIVKLIDHFTKLKRIEVRNNNLNCNQLKSIMARRNIEADVCN